MFSQWDCTHIGFRLLLSPLEKEKQNYADEEDWYYYQVNQVCPTRVLMRPIEGLGEVSGTQSSEEYSRYHVLLNMG